MRRRRRHPWTSGILFLLVACVLTILPLPHWAVAYRPHWVLLACLLWVRLYPESLNFFWLFVVGCYWDLLQGTLLGLHAFMLILTTYFYCRYFIRIVLFPFVQQTLVLGALILLYSAGLLLISHYLGEGDISIRQLGAVLTTTLIWPGLMLCFHLTQGEHMRRFRSL